VNNSSATFALHFSPMASILLFRTDIQQASEELQSLLNAHHSVHRWSIDTEDVDRVLKIVGEEMNEEEILSGLQSLGHCCEALI